MPLFGFHVATKTQSKHSPTNEQRNIDRTSLSPGPNGAGSMWTEYDKFHTSYSNSLQFHNYVMQFILLVYGQESFFFHSNFVEL